MGLAAPKWIKNPYILSHPLHQSFLCHLDRRAHGPDGPPKWMKSRCCVFPRTCHLDRSEAKWRDLRFHFRLRQ
jgi:hypothetical protein